MIRPQKGKNVLFGEAKLKTAQFSCKQTKPFIFGARKLKRFWPRNKKEKRCFCLHKAQNTAICSTLEVNPYSLQKSLKKHHLATKKTFFEGWKTAQWSCKQKKQVFGEIIKLQRSLKKHHLATQKNVFRGMRLKTAQLSCKQRKHVFDERKLKIARFSNKSEKRDFGAKKLKTAW